MSRILLALLALVALSQDEGPLPGAARDRQVAGLTREKEGCWNGPFFFVVLADPQFGMMDPAKERENAEAAVAHINRLKPRFAVALGDLTHPEPGTKGYEEKTAEFRRIFRKVDPAIPFLCLPGNHDVVKRPTKESLAAWKKGFGDDYYSFWAGGVQGLVLDSSLYWDPSGAPEEQRGQEGWLAGQLAAVRKDSPKHLLVFMHHPWFMKTPDDPDDYHSIPKARRVPALAALKEAGVRTVFAGHYHGNVRSRDGDLEMVILGPLGKPLRKDPSGIGIVEVREDGIRHAYYALDAVPEEVRPGR